MKQRYDSYKPSGIDWIGEIPSHWELCPIKHIKSTKEFAFVDGPFGSNLKSEHFIENGDVYVIESGFITTGKFVYKKFKTISKDHFETIRRSECTAGDVIIAKIGYNYGMVGELPKLDKPSVVSGNSLKITLDNSKILNYIFINLMNLAKNRNAYIGLVQETAQPALSLSGLNNFILPVPPLSEQEAIAAWLDEKCDEIDTAIAKVDREIELIDELKQSEISRVVTRGLNPDAPLRPSGIDWINEIPTNWESVKLKHTIKNIETDFMDGDWIESNDISSDGIRYLTSGNIGPGYYKEQGDGFITEETFSRLNCIEVFPGDLLISRLNEPIARTCFIPDMGYRFVTCVDNVIYRPMEDKYDKRYLMYQLNCKPFWFNASQLSSGATMQRISRSKLGTLKVLVPPLPEQQAISDYLDEKCAEIDGLKEKLVKKRDTLKELRQAIISEVVTGKRKVI